MDPRDLPIILYIDDAADARNLVSRVLSPKYLVLEATDALSGIELALDTNPDLILLDINLPRLGGREAAARLNILLPGTPLVAFSAEASIEARQLALAAGFVGYLTKPIDDLEEFVKQIDDFLAGKREALFNADQYQKEFTADLVERLEEKVRELTRTAERNNFLNEQNQVLINALQRRQRLLESAARISHVITSILDLDELLQVSVSIICEEYGFQFAAIFLVDVEQNWAVLRAGSGDYGNELLAKDYGLAIGSRSVVGQALKQQIPQINRIIDGSESSTFSSLIPNCNFELALPLIMKGNVLGALSLHSSQANAYSDEDMPAFQALVDQVAIAISNADLMNDLNLAHQELLRVKTFEAIATATGEAIHWVGNKAAPIPASAHRVQEDLLSLVVGFQKLLELPVDERSHHPLWLAWQDVIALVNEKTTTTSNQFQPFALESMLEDLAIIEQSATTILDVKEDLIGPARIRHVSEIDLPQLLNQTIFEMGLPSGVIKTKFADELPAISGDERQLGQVFNNLIKNAWEALSGYEKPCITINVCQFDEPNFLLVEVKDNGPGIIPEILDKIWVSFFTTKGERGGTGLGLSACMAIIDQHNGKISVQSQLGVGTCFSVILPIKN